MAWPPKKDEEFPADFKLVLIGHDGRQIAFKAHSGGGTYSWDELEHQFIIRARELARDFAYHNG